jgi:hypothetical protein
MFAQQSLTVELDTVRLAAVLAEPHQPWRVDLALDGDGLLAKIGVQVAGIRLYKHGRVAFGAARLNTGPGRTLLPVSWESTGGPPVFPRLEGTLAIEALDHDLGRLTLSANYDPPLGQIGAALDRILLHRLAEATISDFLERLASQLKSADGHPTT